MLGTLGGLGLQMPYGNSVWFALGVAFDMQTLRAQSKLFVKPRTKRLVNILGGYSKFGWLTGLPPPLSGRSPALDVRAEVAVAPVGAERRARAELTHVRVET